MNERIRTLWVKSGMPNEDLMDIVYGKPVILDELYINNFAELIVAECAKVAWANTPDYEELNYGHLISDKIKERFGVK